MSVAASFSLLGSLAVLIGWVGFRRYRTPLNPLTFATVLGIGVFTLLSGVVTSVLAGDLIPDTAIRDTALVSIVYLTGVTLPYLFRGPTPALVFGQFMRLLRLDQPGIATQFQPVKLLLLLAGAAVAFILLAVVGGGGTLWLTAPRQAYLHYRAGAGPFWLLVQWFLMFAWLYFLWSRRPGVAGTVAGLAVVCALAYFTGSKNAILTLGVVAVVYYNFLVRHIRVVPMIGLAVLGFTAVLGLLVLQGAYTELLLSIAYFDYFGTTAHFLARFDEFGYYYGRAWLSSLWFFVPRGLYPDKPYEYGATLIHAVLFPGAAEQGHTPGFLSWTMAYLDFGLIGVFLSGVATGLWPRMAYEYFLRNRESFFAFVFMMQIAIWPVLTFAPVVAVVVWSLLQSFFFRLVWRSYDPAGLAPLSAQLTVPSSRQPGATVP